MYEGTTLCAGCDTFLDPLQALYSPLCSDCYATLLSNLINNKMVGQ